MNRRQMFMSGLAMVGASASSVRAADISNYRLPYERIPSVHADSLSADGRFASMPLRFRPDNEIALVSFEEQVEHRLVFRDWIHAVDTALNRDGSRLAVVCRKNYTESAILIIDTASYSIIETISTPMDIYQRPVYWGDSLFFTRSVTADPERLASRYPGMGDTETDRHGLWRHADGKAELYAPELFGKPAAFDLIDDHTYIYRCDFKSAFYSPALSRQVASDGREICVMDAYAPMQIAAAIGDYVFLVSSEGLVKLKVPLKQVIELFASQTDTGASYYNLRTPRQFEVRLAARPEKLTIKSGHEYNNFHRFNGTDFLVRTPNNGGMSLVMVVTPEGMIQRKMQINTLSDKDARYQTISST